ncbi:MAG: 2-oxoacid:acceptor oxidoreductase family protein [Verrucomicrobiae bacterium]|nr:2-oxoacid:acceptor oxidoreductase family protein [Verrucomicrobiae bacterium]MDW8308351.1 2-oxoacid:acceptor oxidoreductase family protein [Verrucomicrobiales bacterium]
MSTSSGPFPYPGIPTTGDGAAGVVWVETHITQGACAYPITSSTTMGTGYETEVANGKKNLWGDTLVFIQPESEHSAASTCEGFALAGGRVTNFTSGQGLVLMKEVLYTISGKRLPVVFHIGARALTSHSLNVHCGHDDVMSVADCGWGILFARNAQEACDLALIARRAAEASETPFLNVQDGFLTTHTIENLRLPEPEFMKEYVGDPNEKLRCLFDPKFPIMSGVVQNQDSYMKGKIAQRHYYDKVPGAVQEAMEEFYAKTGRRYRMVDTYRMDDAEYALVGMGGMMETAQAAADYMREELDLRVGVVHVTCFAPFPATQIVDALKNVRALTVVERMDNPLAQSNPLAQAIKASFADALTGLSYGSNGEFQYPKITRIPKIYACSAGLGSRDVRGGHFIAIVKNMLAEQPREFSVVGIKHPLALPECEDPDLRPEGAFSMRGHSVGGFGSVTTNKLIASFVGELFNLHVQAYPKYGSEKKGLPTTYYLTVASKHIRTHSELSHVEFIPLNDVNAFNLGNPLEGIADEGSIFIQSPETDPQKVWDHIPPYGQKIIRNKRLKVFYLDTVKIAREIATDPDLQQRMQGVVLVGIFIKVTPFAARAGMSDEQVLAAVEKYIRKYFGKRGEHVVQENLRCVREGLKNVKEIPWSIISAPPAPKPRAEVEAVFTQ